MKFSNLVFMLLAATAAVAVNGEDCPQQKCKSTCTLKGDPHLARFGEKDSGFLHGKGKEYIKLYQHGKTKYLAQITSNGKNEYVTGVKIRNPGKKTVTVHAKTHCAKGNKGRRLLTERMLEQHGIELKCSSIKRGQYRYVDRPHEKHYDLKIHRDLPNGAHKNGRLLAKESGACMGEHTVKCDCGNPSPTPPHPKPHHPHRRPTPKPSDGPSPHPKPHHPHRSPTPKPSDGPSPSSKPSCKKELADDCGTPSANCWKGSVDGNCTAFLKCVDENHHGKCYTPVTCKQALEGTCGEKPEACDEGMENNKDCTDFLTCVKENNFEECYAPENPTPSPEPSPSNETVTCSASCSAKGDPHFNTYLGEKYKTDAGGKTIAMIKEISGFAVEAYVDPIDDKEFITRVSFGDQEMTVEDCTNGTTVQKIDTETLQGTVECAKPNKGFEQYGYHLNVKFQQKFTMPASEIQSATIEIFAQAMGVMADSECLSGSDGDGAAVASWDGEKLAKKFHCH